MFGGPRIENPCIQVFRLISAMRFTRPANLVVISSSELHVVNSMNYEYPQCSSPSTPFFLLSYFVFDPTALSNLTVWRFQFNFFLRHVWFSPQFLPLQTTENIVKLLASNGSWTASKRWYVPCDCDRDTKLYFDLLRHMNSSILLYRYLSRGIA
jgi:hypothetical protein